jgi:hypothetical protein
MRNEQIREAGGLRYLAFPALDAAGVLHGFTLRHGGVSQNPFHTLNLGDHVGDNPLAVQENRIRLAAALGYEARDVTAGEQVHGVQIRRVGQEERGRGHFQFAASLPGTDGLVTQEPGIVLMAHAADCTLLFFADPQNRCAGLAHAGWRGAVGGMAAGMVHEMALLGCLRENIHVALSPSIGPCCYRVGEEVIRSVPPEFQGAVLQKREDGIYFDLPGLQVRQLLAAGLREEHIVRSRYCTHCHSEHFFSYRASGGRTGRMAGIMAIHPVRQAIP